MFQSITIEIRYFLQCEYLASVPLGLGNTVSETMIAHSGNALSLRQRSRRISTLYVVAERSAF